MKTTKEDKVIIQEIETDNIDFIVGEPYGNFGIKVRNKNHCNDDVVGVCLSRSGDSLCGCYCGNEKINIHGQDLFIVYCLK